MKIDEDVDLAAHGLAGAVIAGAIASVVCAPLALPAAFVGFLLGGSPRADVLNRRQDERERKRR